MPYSFEETISSFSAFYLFLTELPYIPSSAVCHPPTAGWPSIDEVTFSHLGKNRQVLKLLRHLPYLDGEDWNIAYDTKVIPYNSPRVKDCLENGGSQENSGLIPFYCESLPEHVVALTCGDNYGSWLMCDTNEGTISEYSVMDGRHWRDFPTLPITEFLEEWKQKYMQLEWIPEPGRNGNVALAGANKEEELEELRQIYRAFGWPSHFRRDECRQVLLDRAEEVRRILLQKSKDDTDREWLRKTTEKLAQATI